MEGPFTRDLDFALDYLYKTQYLGDTETWGKKLADEMGLPPWDSARGHESCVSLMELGTKLLLYRPDKGVPPMQGLFVIEQLARDGYIDAHEHDTSRSGHIRLTNAGRMFKERGGYRRLRLSEIRKAAWTIAKTTAAVINAVAVIWLTWRSAQSADADTLQDEQIIGLERRNTALEQRNADLEILLDRWAESERSNASSR